MINILAFFKKGTQHILNNLFIYMEVEVKITQSFPVGVCCFEHNGGFEIFIEYIRNLVNLGQTFFFNFI